MRACPSASRRCPECTRRGAPSGSQTLRYACAERGENGRGYLIGDENLSFQDYFGAFFRAAGRPVPPVRDEEHPLLPDAAILFGRGNSLFYEPDAAETAQLGYRRGDINRTVETIVAQFRE